MNNADATKVKQQIVEKIKSSTNILVTVSRDPSVDDLSAAIGLSTLLNKIGKHSTAIFSGALPPAISFLEPDKVFENTADSLRDFIIALDKEKADHLRYKVDGDVVKIFITPYRTTITSDDLEFSQGDFNVELVLALGVDNQEHLDTALSAHGNIMDEVTIATFTTGTQTSSLGVLDWHDDNASSLSEMVTSISEALKTDKPVLDKQIATALLTGIVAATDRFSNSHTTSKVMTMAAQLMAAGADQQLIASKLREAHEIQAVPEVKPATQNPIIEEQEPEITPLEDIAGKLTIDHSPVEMPKPNIAENEPPHQYDNITPAIQPIDSVSSDIQQSSEVQPINMTPEQELANALNSELPPIAPVVDLAAELEAAAQQTPVVAEPATASLDSVSAPTLPDLSDIYAGMDDQKTLFRQHRRCQTSQLSRVILISVAQWARGI